MTTVQYLRIHLNVMCVAKQHNKKGSNPFSLFCEGGLHCLFLFDFMFHVYTDDEKPPPVSSSVNTASVPAALAKPAPHSLFMDRFQELDTYR